MPDQIVRHIASQLQHGGRLSLALAVERSGSVPCPVGAMLLLDQKGASYGTIGGGRLEQSVQQALCQEPLTARLRRYRLQPDLGMSCGGAVAVLLVPNLDDPTGRFAEAASLLEQGRSCTLSAALDGAGNVQWQLEPVQPAFQPTGQQTFCIVLKAAGQLLICGAGHIAQALAPLAVQAGFRVTVLDDRHDYLAAQTFPEKVSVRQIRHFDACLNHRQIDENSFVLIATYSHHHDQAVLEQALTGCAGYIGMVGSRRKRQALFGKLRATGAAEAKLSSVRCPAGLAIGAETPAEIAISILAEMIAVRRGQSR